MVMLVCVALQAQVGVEPEVPVEEEAEETPEQIHPIP